VEIAFPLIAQVGRNQLDGFADAFLGKRGGRLGLDSGNFTLDGRVIFAEGRGRLKGLAKNIALAKAGPDRRWKSGGEAGAWRNAR